MSRENLEKEGITLLGNQKVKYPDNYAPEVLETFLNKHPGNDYFVKFNCPEFTSLCPITGQPDFATITISYVPGEKMVESKSLKLYLFSFRNHGDFHEDCVNIIMKDLIRLMDPKYIEVWGKFTPRGGISIDPYCNYGKPGTPIMVTGRFERRYNGEVRFEVQRIRLLNEVKGQMLSGISLDLEPEEVNDRLNGVLQEILKSSGENHGNLTVRIFDKTSNKYIKLTSGFKIPLTRELTKKLDSLEVKYDFSLN